jgi:SOS response regulatory protein OraA/RecX
LVKTYRVECHESPKQDRNLLVKGYDVQTLWQVSGVGVNDILKVLAEPIVERIQVHASMDDSQQAEELIRGQILNNLLLQLLVYFMLLPCQV